MDELGLSDGLFEDEICSKSNTDDKSSTATEGKEKGCNGSIKGLALQSYIPKQCTENWFFGISVVEDSSIEDCILLKSEADLLYYQKEFLKAGDRYKELICCRDFIQSKPVLRELHESCCRCALKLGNADEAEKHLLPLLDLHANGNDASVHLLAYDVYEAQGNHLCALEHIVKAVNTNTLYPKFWLNFYCVLEKLERRGSVSLFIDGFNCSITNDLLCAVLLQGQFFLSECVRGQTDDRVSHFDSVKSELEAKLESLKTLDASLLARVQSELPLSLLIEDSEEDLEERTRGSFLSRWLNGIIGKLC